MMQKAIKKIGKKFLISLLLSSLHLHAAKSCAFFDLWQKNPVGIQKFTISQTDADDETIEITGALKWDLYKNIWRFEYTADKIVLEVKDDHMYKISEDGNSTKYPCSGIAVLLKHPMNTWYTFLKVESEIQKDNIGILIASYNKKSIIFQYLLEPFTLLQISFEDPSSADYVTIAFAEHQ